MQRYITTPLYYVNAQPHIGHAYTTFLADVLKKHYVQRGEKVTFLTGTDEHGDKIAQTAQKEGITPLQLANRVSDQFRSTWDALNIRYDIFYRTTLNTHYEAVQYALQFLKDKGEIVFKEYEGNYCVGCERFLTDTELTEKGFCPDHLKAPEKRKEGNYFFLMSRYRNKLIEHFEKNPNSIRPENFRNEVLSFLKGQELGDLCISRPKSRLEWGIEIPFDKNFVTYVWFDALLNYLVATGWPNQFNREQWSGVRHLIGKDILKTHAIYWGAILMSLDVLMFQELQVNGYWLMDGAKMSKSLGNVVGPMALENYFGKETLRFFFLREMSYGNDSSFTAESLVNGVNAYLANGIGNLASRLITMCLKNFDGNIHRELWTASEHLLIEKCIGLKETWNDSFKELKYQNALKAWSEIVTACDLYINEQKPWALAKDPEMKARLQVVLGCCLVALHALATIIWPVLPVASAKLFHSLGMSFDSQVGPDLNQVGLKEVHNIKLSTEVPKLFMRVALPVVTES